MSKVIFSGSVSAQEKAGETITITITKPDNTTEVITTTTLDDKTFATTKDYGVPGNYSAVFHVDADAIYTAANSAPVPFTVPLQARTITAKVSVE